jgi:hypothetical protein
MEKEYDNLRKKSQENLVAAACDLMLLEPNPAAVRVPIEGTDLFVFIGRKKDIKKLLED